MIAFRKPRHLIPAAALFAATFFLVSAVPHVVAPVVAPAAHLSSFDVVRAEIHLCETSGERSHDECIDEVEAKALIQHAEQLAQAEGRRGAGSDDALAAAARPSRSRVQ